MHNSVSFYLILLGFISAQSISCEDWSEWSECPVSCGGPEQEKRTRRCQLVDSVGALIQDNIVQEETRTCAMEECPPPRMYPKTHSLSIYLLIIE